MSLLNPPNCKKNNSQSFIAFRACILYSSHRKADVVPAYVEKLAKSKLKVFLEKFKKVMYSIITK